MPGATTAVILGGGLGRRFTVLTSREAPKALLPLANAPLISYPVEWVAAAGLQRAIVVVGACEAWQHSERSSPASLRQPARRLPALCRAG